MNITEIIPTELSGYCDVQTGECITAETDTPRSTTKEDVAHANDQSPTTRDHSENRQANTVLERQ